LSSVTGRNRFTQNPTAIRYLHEEFTLRITGSSDAKVGVAYGRPTQNRILQTMKCNILPLWEHFEGIPLAMAHERNFHNAEEHFKFRKGLLFATHPQHTFCEQRKNLISVSQDLATEVALLIKGVDRDFEYYQSKQWRRRVSALRAEELLQSLSPEAMQ